MRWTEDELAAFQARGKGAASKDARRGPDRILALGRLRTGQMNKTEAAYDGHLAEQSHAGAILWHKFEGLKLRLADSTFYTPDFAVIAADGVLELHEVKGFMQEDANVKIKVAACTYPFRFKIVRVRAKKNGGGWDVAEVGA